MSIRSRINLFTLFLLAALSTALIVTSYVVINQVLIGQNTASLTRQLDNIDFNIRQSHQDLSDAGLISVASYVEAEKKRILDMLRGYAFGKSGKAFVLDPEGAVVFHPTIPRGETFPTAFVQGIRDRHASSHFYERDGKSYFAVFHRSTHWDWLLVMSVAEEELFEMRESYVSTAFLLCALALVIVGIVLLGFSRLIQKKINDTLRGLEKMQHGDLDARIAVKAHDEFGTIQRGINSMTEQLQTMVAELSASRAKYYDLYEQSPDCLMSVDVESRVIVECNSRVLELTGYPREEIIGRLIFDMYDVECRDQAMNAAKTLAETGEVHNVELTVRHKDGSMIDVILDAAGFRDSHGRLLFTRSSWTDITQRKAIEESLRDAKEAAEAANEKLIELDRMKSMFIASVSHELRTPLNTIIGFSGMMLEGLSGELSDTQRDEVTRVNRAGKHLLTLISDMIDISKIEAGWIESFPEHFSLETVVNETAEEVELEMMSKGMALKFDVPSWPELYTDRIRLRQCLLNLLSNAVKYSEEGTVTIAVRQTNGRVDVAVKDTGVGIAKDEIPKLFQPFERLDSKLRIKAGGTGLGLYLTRKLMTDVLKGHISVESTPDEGSSFILHFPHEIAPKNGQAVDGSLPS